MGTPFRQSLPTRMLELAHKTSSALGRTAEEEGKAKPEYCQMNCGPRSRHSYLPCRGLRKAGGSHGLHNRPSAKADLATGPTPTARGRAGTTRHGRIARQGIPLACSLLAANVPGGKMREVTRDVLPPEGGTLQQQGKVQSVKCKVLGPQHLTPIQRRKPKHIFQGCRGCPPRDCGE